MEALQRECAEINARQQMAGDYLKTLALLRALQAGDIGLRDFEMVGDGWRLVVAPPVVEMIPASEPAILPMPPPADG